MKPFIEKHKTPNHSLSIYDFEDYESYDYYDDYYSMYENSYDSGEYYFYAYIEVLDRFIVDETAIVQVDSGYETTEIYKDEDGNLHGGVYTHIALNKIEAFFGCVEKVIQFSNIKSKKIKKIYDIMLYKYPEIYLKIHGKFGAREWV